MAKVGDKIGHWTLRRFIDSGGQGQVFAATREEGGEEFAIKVIRAARPKKRARFIQEVKTHVTLSAQVAANIIQVLDHNLEELGDGSVTGFIVMPLAATTLEKQQDVLTGRIELCLELFLGIVNGISSAHLAGIVHRDIKPGNVLFTNHSLREPKVSDFGICLLRDTPDEERLTEVGETVGAKYFMAPEQERGGVADITASADIYALGKLLHHMLTGRLLYREQLGEAFTPEEFKLDPRYKQIHAEILQKTVVENPAARIQSAKELFEIARRILGKRQNGPSSGGVKGDRGGPNTPVAPAHPELIAYKEFGQVIGRGDLDSAKLEFDNLRVAFRSTWAELHETIKTSPRGTKEAAATLIGQQPRATALLLAIGRYDVEPLFRPAKQFIESLLRASEHQSGYPAVFTVPHVQAGFLFMATSLVALHFESWKTLHKLLTEKFEWYYQSGKPLFSYGFALSYFFHPEALRRGAGETHDFYRSSLASDPVIQSFGFSGDELLNKYVQIQFIMSLRVSQLLEKGIDCPSWPDFGRFHGYRIEPVLQRMYHDTEYGDQLLRIFGETRDQFFSQLNKRLSVLERRLQGGNYFWDSLSSWEP